MRLRTPGRPRVAMRTRVGRGASCACPERHAGMKSYGYLYESTGYERAVTCMCRAVGRRPVREGCGPMPWSTVCRGENKVFGALSRELAYVFPFGKASNLFCIKGLGESGIPLGWGIHPFMSPFREQCPEWLGSRGFPARVPLWGIRAVAAFHVSASSTRGL